MDDSQIPTGMDPTSTFKLEIRSTSERCRKDVASYYAITKFVDKDTTNYKDFIDDFAEKYPWGLNECLQLSYFNADLKANVPVTNDQDMMAMFAAFESSKCIVLNAHIAPLNPSRTVTANTENAPQSVSETMVNDVSCNQSKDEASTPASSGPNKASTNPSLIPVLCDTSYLANPFPMYEHVGVDDEVMYGVKPVDVTFPTVGVVVEKSLPHDESEGEEESNEGGEESSEGGESSEEVESSEDGDSSGDEGSSEEREEAEVTPNEAQIEDWVARDIISDFTPSVAYDKEDPPMTVGSMYPSIAEFRIALSQHAIKHEREFNIEKTDSERVRAYCSQKKKGCKWRIHASTLQDNVTVQVKVNPYKHTCSSRRRSKKMKNATAAWISEQVLDWIREDPSVGAKELQSALQNLFVLPMKLKLQVLWLWSQCQLLHVKP